MDNQTIPIITRNVHIRYYTVACQELDIPYTLDVRTRRLHIVTKTGKKVFCYMASTPLNLQPAVTLSKSKYEVHELLRPLNIATPKQIIANNHEDLFPFFNEHKQIVVKPEDSHGGLGITILPSKSELAAAFLRAKKHSETVLAETYVTGDNFRFLVLDDTVLSVAIRRPPMITGDGITNIRTMFNDLNTENKAQKIPLIPNNAYTWDIVKGQGYNKSDVLPAGKTIKLRLTANLSLGGTVDDVTETCDQSYKEIAIKVTKVLGLRFAGIDIIAEDLTQPNKAVFVIEANAAPGMRIHYKNEKGAQRNVAKIIMSAIYEL